MANLQEEIKSYIGGMNWDKIEIPNYITSSLDPNKVLRPYQIECFKYFISYFEHYNMRVFNPNLLFYMATGSGKTMIMAGAILYLYAKGYRNFLFIVHLDTILSKTRDNFLNKNSTKYLFAQSIFIDNKEIEINAVKNFDESRDDCINICFTSIHKLHSDFTIPRENALTYESFSEKAVVVISDEAHHLNADTKKNNKLTEEQKLNNFTWEEIVTRIHNASNMENKGNILLEFTATEDFKNSNIVAKYNNKIIFDYPLKKFRHDGYSKEVASIGSDTDHINRIIQAIVLSQYKKHLFASIGVQAKPVILFKSKTKPDNKKIFKVALNCIEDLSFAHLRNIYENAQDDILRAFEYFYNQDHQFQTLIAEIRQDFNSAHSVIIDTDNNVADETMVKLNTLEDENNEIRAIYAVDMLNEGWDVLNLFDIVRLYDTRDGKYVRGEYIPGSTTNTEAQLIGRGARYFPFEDPEHKRSKDKRKFDMELDNPLKIIETVHYHCTKESDYIKEIKTALVKFGAIDSEEKYVEEKIKEKFKETNLFKTGYVYVNELIKEPAFTNVNSITQFKENHLKATLHSGSMSQTYLVSEDEEVNENVGSKYKSISLFSLGENVIRSAINNSKSLYFSELKKTFPNLESIRQFIKDENYLGGIIVDVYNYRENLSQSEKRYIATEVINQIEPVLSKEGIKRRGSHEFRPQLIRNTFKDHLLKVSTENTDKEYGKSMQNSTDPCFAMDVNNAEWHAYNDCFGTSEEKCLVKFIESIMDKLKEKYSDIYLLRNEQDLKLYSFDKGDVFEPDYVMFMRKLNNSDNFDSIQLFIEPKGEGYRAKDKWKEDFLLSMKDKATIYINKESSDYHIWGLPFYTESQKRVFSDAFASFLFDSQK